MLVERLNGFGNTENGMFAPGAFTPLSNTRNTE